MPGTTKKIGPIALTTTLTTNIFNNTSALIYDLIKHIHVSNKTASAATFSLWLGATGGNAAGTELFTGYSIPAFSAEDFYFPGGLKMLSTDFLVGGAGTTLALTITMTSEQYVV